MSFRPAVATSNSRTPRTSCTTSSPVEQGSNARASAAPWVPATRSSSTPLAASLRGHRRGPHGAGRVRTCRTLVRLGRARRCRGRRSDRNQPNRIFRSVDRVRRIEDLNDALSATLERLGLPWDAAFLAGKRFLRYRRAGGTRRSPLPDFSIGAHAAVAGMSVLTRDPSSSATYLPNLTLITP